ncbi:hypothetical protein [Abyssisolibacter fermentans]|uniref:hypothetical protein n=1 Tax=Abyssisolibacter fermentans TaxID=1766203 RepID=UPI000832A598|nr:hypothetical protein [Abyssisolibacter fermentans]
MHKPNTIEVTLWSIAIPGFGQLINKKYIKGIIFISLEFLINMKSNLNIAIILSFQGKISAAINQVNYQWLMFYPCIYMFAIWDAFIDSSNERKSSCFLPFVVAAYSGTIGVIYSENLKFMGILFGPVWLPLIFIFLGIVIGFIVNKLFLYKAKN